MSEEGKQNKLNAHPMGNTEMSPGDQAPVGTPGTGENVCPKCGGKGRYQGQPCDKCDGTGIVNEGIGGA
jgi:DnaJ-class molecular chaperone